jgi:hypothetical protein
LHDDKIQKFIINFFSLLINNQVHKGVTEV